MTGEFDGRADGETLACWACARPLPLEALTRDGFLKSRSEGAGGPYLLAACPHCRRRLRCERNGSGRHFISPADDFGALDHLLQFFDADLRRRYWEEKAWRARHEEARRRFFDAEKTSEPNSPPSSPPPLPHSGRPNHRTVSSAPAPAAPAAVRRALAVLGVTEREPWESVARAFRRQCKLCHPDRFALHDEAYRAVAARRFAAVKEAYDLLRREWKPASER